jgi:parallel beta-helix repeat protein
MKTFSLVISGLTFLFLPLTVFSETIRVPGDYPTIQAAVDVSIDGDTVLIADGVYTGEGNINIKLKDKKIVIKSEFGAENCIIDGSGNENAVCFNPPDSSSLFKLLAIIQGLTIQHFSTAVYCHFEGSSPVIKDNVFRNCYGEILSFGDGAQSIIINNEIFNNSLDYDLQGIIHLSGSNVTLKNNYIHDNQLSKFTELVKDGIIFCEWNDSSIIENNKIINNKGCGIFLDNHVNNVKIIGNEIRNNETSKLVTLHKIKYNRYQDPIQSFYNGYQFSGGAIALFNGSTASVYNNLIVENKGTHSGGIYCDSTSVVKMVNNDLIHNGSYLYGSATLNNPSSIVMNNIIINSYDIQGSMRVERWFSNNLFWQINYAGVKRSSVDYYVGFKNNGETGDVKIKGAGYSNSFSVQSGEYYWLKTTSKVDDYGNYGGLDLEIILGSDTLAFVNSFGLLYGGCILLYDINLQSFGTTFQGMTAPGSGILAMADDQFQSISYNDFNDNQGGNFVTKIPKNATTVTEENFPGEGNILGDPKLNSAFALLSGSPCIDAGNPAIAYNDANLPAGKGTARNDIGISGGPMNSSTEQLPSSVINHAFPFDLRLYPNPTVGEVNLDLGKTYENLTIEIAGITGQIIESRTINNTDRLNFSIAGPAGIYFLSLRTSKGECAFLKIVKEER